MMGKEILYELIEQVNDDEIEIVQFVLSRIVRGKSFTGLEFEEDDPLPDEIEIIKEYEEAKARGEKFRTHEEICAEMGKQKTKVA